MSKSTFIDFRAVKREVTMVQVLEHYGLMSQMKQNGDSITGIQPKCPDFQRREPPNGSHLIWFFSLPASLLLRGWHEIEGWTYKWSFRERRNHSLPPTSIFKSTFKFVSVEI